MPNVEIIIERRRAEVWNVFTTPEKWERWWGGGLRSVDPGWEKGGRMVWKVGVPSPITLFAEHKEVTITDAFLIQHFRFRDAGMSSTSFEIEFTPNGGATFPDGGAAHSAQLFRSLSKFKELAESEIQAEPGGSGQTKAWWQFWK